MLLLPTDLLNATLKEDIYEIVNVGHGKYASFIVKETRKALNNHSLLSLSSDHLFSLTLKSSVSGVLPLLSPFAALCMISDK